MPCPLLPELLFCLGQQWCPASQNETKLSVISPGAGQEGQEEEREVRCISNPTTCKGSAPLGSPPCLGMPPLAHTQRETEVPSLSMVSCLRCRLLISVSPAPGTGPSTKKGFWWADLAHLQPYFCWVILDPLESRASTQASRIDHSYLS